MSNQRVFLLGGSLLLAVAAVSGFGFLMSGERAAAPVSEPSPQQTASAAPATETAPLPSAVVPQTAPPAPEDKSAKTIQMRPLPVTEGIRCPDGTFLPLLNGVKSAPPIMRKASLGPVPPIVGKIVDSSGCEWWLHEDDSVTTTRPIMMEKLDPATGRTIRYPDIETVHAGRVPDEYAIKVPEPQTENGPGNTQQR